MLSRYTDAGYVHPDPYKDPGRFINHLVEFLRTTERLAVAPMSDRSHTILSRYKERIEQTGTIAGVEQWDTFVAANNKQHLAELAEELSIPAPATHAPDSIAAVEKLEQQLQYPVLIKPRLTSITDDDGGYSEVRISDENYVHSSMELVSRYRSLMKEYDRFKEDPLIIQEVIPGTTNATSALANDGQVLAFFQEERLRTYPVDGGASSLRQGVYKPEMLEHAREIIRALEWTGPIYVEFIETDDEEAILSK